MTLIGNGLLGGLVSVTAGALNMNMFGAMVVAFFGGVIATNGVLLLDRFRIDDPVGAIPVHLFCGAWGTIAVGIFADPDAVIGGGGPAGLLYGGVGLLVTQITGLVAVWAFVALASVGLFVVLKEVGWLRVSAEHEMVGLDLAEHATPAYNDDYVEYAEELFDSADIDAWYDEVA